ncbi:MAG: hypothetical protein DYG89_03790 [Caldilinea sp. CFX5]|nr:hypothetical protein [Caldilinea sp. CFX5]
MSIALVAGSLNVAAVATTFAATPAERAGYSAATAAMPTAGNKVLLPGQWDWYVFRSQVPLNQDKNEHGRFPGATIDATMHIINGQGSFEIWTPDMVRQWIANESFDPVGKGTQVYVQNTINPSGQQLKDNTMDANDIAADKPVKGHHAILDLATSNYHWEGNFPGSGDYYLIVKNSGNQPLNYTLTVTGDLVFPSQLTVATR